MKVGLQRDHTERVLGLGGRRWAGLGWGNSRRRRGGDGPKFGHRLVDRSVFFRKAHADAGVHLAKRAHRDGGDAVVPGPAHRQVAVRFPGQQVVRHIQDLEVPSLGRLPGECCVLEALKQPVSLGLVDGSQFTQVGLGVIRDQVACQGFLERGPCGKHVVLVHFPELPRELGWGGHPANLPAGGVEELPETSRHQGAVSKLRMPPRHRGLPAVVDHGSVHFVAQHPSVGAFHSVGQQVELGRGEHIARGVVGAVQHHNSGAGAHGLVKGLVVVQRNADHLGEVQFSHRRIEVVPGFLHDHLVAGLEQGRHGGVEHTRCASTHGDFCFWTIPCPGVVNLGDPSAKRLVPWHGCVLVVPVFHGVRGGLPQRHGGGQVGKSLGHIQGPMRLRQGRHFRENGGAHIRHLGGRQAGLAVHRITANLTTSPFFPWLSVAKAKYTPYGAGLPLSRLPSQVARPPLLSRTATRIPETSVMCTVLL